jgi:hypothetical protein
MKLNQAKEWYIKMAKLEGDEDITAGVPDAQTSYAMNAEDDGTVTGYMCLTDWECEIGAASGGTKVYPSINDIKRNRKCVDGCGIVEVSVAFKRVVQPNRDNNDDEYGLF